MKIKNLLPIFLALCFGLSTVLISVSRVSQSQVRAQDEEEKISIDKPIKSDEVDYYLAYPGVLPDNPFYWLKMIRDRVLLWSARDPEVKFQRLLLYADKRIGAAKVLIEGGKIQLGVTTLTKGEKYLEQAVVQLEQLKILGKITQENIDKSNKAVLKHQEIIRNIIQKTSDQTKNSIQDIEAKTKQTYRKLEEIKENK